jgi:hypothetical protein
MGLQLLSFVAVVLVVEPRRVATLQERVRELLEGAEGRTAEQVRQQMMCVSLLCCEVVLCCAVLCVVLC